MFFLKNKNILTSSDALTIKEHLSQTVKEANEQNKQSTHPHSKYWQQEPFSLLGLFVRNVKKTWNQLILKFDLQFFGVVSFNLFEKPPIFLLHKTSNIF